MATLIDYILIPLHLKTISHAHALCIDMIPSDPQVSKCNQSRWPSIHTGFHGHHVMTNSSIAALRTGPVSKYLGTRSLTRLGPTSGQSLPRTCEFRSRFIDILLHFFLFEALPLDLEACSKHQYFFWFPENTPWCFLFSFSSQRQLLILFEKALQKKTNSTRNLNQPKKKSNYEKKKHNKKIIQCKVNHEQRITRSIN